MKKRLLLMPLVSMMMLTVAFLPVRGEESAPDEAGETESIDEVTDESSNEETEDAAVYESEADENESNSNITETQEELLPTVEEDVPEPDEIPEEQAEEQLEKEEQTEAVAGREYSYEIIPVLPPFDRFLFVRTDNPDPYSFDIYDVDNIYQREDLETYYHVDLSEYYDISYEDVNTHRINGGYLFRCNGDSDGGVLEIRSAGNSRIKTQQITVQELMSADDYLIRNYTDPSKDFFSNLDAVQNGMLQLSVYPLRIRDPLKPNPDFPYPGYMASIYPELSLNLHYEGMYLYGRDVFINELYPYVLDSYSFPNMIMRIAKTLDSSVTFEGFPSAHWMVKVTKDGETRFFGGSGKGGGYLFFCDNARQLYCFTQGEDDLLGREDALQTIEDTLQDYDEIGRLYQMEIGDQLQGDGFKETIGTGAWAVVGKEGSSYTAREYAYFTAPVEEKTPIPASDCWVDGRYINKYECFEYGAKFTDHPKASIILHNQTYTDSGGKERTGDLYYLYNSSTNQWGAVYNYYQDYNCYWWSELPDSLVLSEDQVKKMILDSNTDTAPEKGFVYNSIEPPGTPFVMEGAESIQIKGEYKYLAVNTGMQLKAVTKPESANETAVVWESLNPTIASVNSYGMVTGLNAGTAVIRAVTREGGLKAEYTIKVGNYPTAINMHTWNITLYPGDQRKMTYKIYPDDAVDKTITWISADDSIARVDKNGNVTAVKGGSTDIIGTSVNGVQGVCHVVVRIPASSLSFNENKVEIPVDSRYQLSVSIKPENCNIAPIWVSRNREIATVDQNGIVTGIKPGTATIAVWTNNPYIYRECKVTVTDGPLDIRLNAVELELEKGQSFDLLATLTPADVVKDTVKWTSSDAKTVSVKGGKITALKTGTAIITAETVNGKSVQCTVIVNNNNAAVFSVNPTSLKLVGSQSLYLSTEKTYREINWTVDHPEIVEISDYGKLTGKKAGFAKVTAGTEDNQTASVDVMVLFEDVSKTTQYYYDAVYWAVDNGITQGTGPTTFNPTGFCKRYQFVLFLWRQAGCPEPTLAADPFTDVKADPKKDAYEKAVLWAVENGITTGTTSTTFEPYAALTRGQVVTFMYRAAKEPEVMITTNPFKDVQTEKYYYTPVMWAAENKITTGVKPDEFQPTVTCTRGQTVVFMYRLFK